MKPEFLHSLPHQLDQHIFLIHVKIYNEMQSKYRIYVITFVCVNTCLSAQSLTLEITDFHET